MNILTFLSGISAALFAWFFLVIPSRFAKINPYKQPISYTGILPDKVGRLFNIGLVGSGVSQIVYFFGIAQTLKFSYLPVGLLILIFGSLSIVLAGFITLKTSKSLHTLLASLYFSLTAIGALLFEFQSPLESPIKLIGIVLVLLVTIGMVYFYVAKRSMAYVAYWGIATSTLWVAHFYFVL